MFINKNLTARRAKLFKQVRDKKRPHKKWKVWTLHGKIFAKTDSVSNTLIQIKTDEDLGKLLITPHRIG